MQPLCSVIIVTYNSVDVIDACLTALAQLRAAERFQLVVVDNASTDDTTSLIQTRHPQLKLLIQAENVGFAGGVNRGVLAATSPLIALLNPDAAPHPDWIEQLIAPLKHPAIGITGSKVLGRDRRIQSVGCTVTLPLLLPQYRGAGEVDNGQYDEPADVWSVHGAAMAFRRDVWAAVGGFDEGFFPAYLEESDFCERARRAGWRVVTAPGAVAEHAESTTTGKYSAEFFYYFLRNRLRFAAKWLTQDELWSDFRPAEHRRLQTTQLLDRRVARLVYHEGVPPLSGTDPAGRAAVLHTGRQLREAGPSDGLDPILALLDQAAHASLHHETQFRSRLPLVAALRGSWNNVATRWYIRPNLDQQSRYNLALQHAAQQLVAVQSAQSAAHALDSALLAWRLHHPGNSAVS